MSFVAIAVGASAVIGAAGAIMQGRAAKANADYNAKVKQNQAESEFLEAKEQASRTRANNKKLLARNLAIRASQGISITSGSSLLVDQETASALELKALEDTRSQDNRSRRLNSEAQVLKAQGKAAVKQSYFEAGASLIGGAAGVMNAMPPKVSGPAIDPGIGKMQFGPSSSIGPMTGAPVRNSPFNLNAKPSQGIITSANV